MAVAILSTQQGIVSVVSSGVGGPCGSCSIYIWRHVTDRAKGQNGMLAPVLPTRHVENWSVRVKNSLHTTQHDVNFGLCLVGRFALSLRTGAAKCHVDSRTFPSAANLASSTAPRLEETFAFQTTSMQSPQRAPWKFLKLPCRVV